VERLFDALNGEWRLLMIHFHITDLFGHAFWGTEKLATLYEEMDLLTKRVKERLGADDLVLIISDHGMSRLGHTKKGFFSLNMRLGLEKPDIKDFFKIVTGLLAED
jgi:phosphopentomutase